MSNLLHGTAIISAAILLSCGAAMVLVKLLSLLWFALFGKDCHL